MNPLAASKYVWWGWGGLDALFLMSYMLRSLWEGKLPFYADAISALNMIEDHGSYAAVFIVLGWMLQLSFFVSCILLFRQSRWGWRLVWLQLPFRLLFFVPSASVLFTYMGFHFSAGSVAFVLLMVASELAKVWSLWFFKDRAVPVAGMG
ncbi:MULTISPECIES: hypothetical protein [Pseudomonas]|uniref:hypothetical protein n=1 Tax=Pseudomonas TaxID=286 RepID=UPI00224AF821|nr:MULTISPECIES: hypothetical protein [unclassified Pseudomonas]MCX2890813.1 hypothetical protein [Pseudomonas sp. DCB_BI]MDH4549774.1 hypothetical protein [Pseudomonas sp. BN607]